MRRAHRCSFVRCRTVHKPAANHLTSKATPRSDSEKESEMQQLLASRTRRSAASAFTRIFNAVRRAPQIRDPACF
ncbi:MAG: hypothetical protein OJF62_002727 [Pseudolabrys sp.]|nr:hypothetical protein [Pseudolabrys sp.]